MKTKIVQRDSLIAIIKQLKNEGKRVISTSGCFDILHAGHVQYLREAKAKGDILVIMLNSDVSVRMLKGASRPIVCRKTGRMYWKLLKWLIIFVYLMNRLHVN